MLRASCDGVEAQVRVLVPSDALDAAEQHRGIRAAAVQISSAPRSVRAGDSFVVTALPLDATGQALHDAPVLWSSSDVQVAVVTAGGWVAALGRGQAVLTATCGLASGSVTIYVEQAQPAAPAKRPRRLDPLPVPPAEAPHRSSWRRRGARGRRRVVNAGLLLLAAAGSVYVFGGLPDGSRSSGEAVAADTIPGANAALEAAVRPESIPPINRGAQAVTAQRRPLRPAPKRVSAPAADAPSDSARLGATAEVSGRQNPGRPDTGSTSFLPNEPLALADSSDPGLAAPVGPEREVAGYRPMAAADPPPRGEPAPAPPLRTAKSAPARSPAPEKPDDRPVDRRKLESRIREGVEDCYRILRSKDVERLARLYDPKTEADQEKLQRLSRILRTEPWQAVVGRRVDGVRELGSRSAAGEFSFRLTWRDSYGGRLSSQPIFRAEFTRDADDWNLSSCRIVGSPKL
jgi:hypothetical protein